MKKEVRNEIENICNEVVREAKKIYNMSLESPFTEVDFKKGKRTLKQALIYLVKLVEEPPIKS